MEMLAEEQLNIVQDKMGTHSCVVDVLAADGQQDLPNVHTRAYALGLAKGAAHAGLQANQV